MKIDTPKYSGDCRRNNGRLRLAFRDILLVFAIILIPLGGGIIAGTVAWTKLDGKVEAYDDKFIEQEKKLVKVEKAPMDIALIQQDVGHIKNDMSELKEDMDDFIIEQKQVNGKFEDKLDSQSEQLIKILEAVR